MLLASLKRHLLTDESSFDQVKMEWRRTVAERQVICGSVGLQGMIKQLRKQLEQYGRQREEVYSNPPAIPFEPVDASRSRKQQPPANASSFWARSVNKLRSSKGTDPIAIHQSVVIVNHNRASTHDTFKLVANSTNRSASIDLVQTIARELACAMDKAQTIEEAYTERLDLLRVKAKAAELREKLLR